MITAQDSLNSPLSLRDFTAAKQVSFFESLKQNRFSGQLVMASPKGEKWFFYLYLGRIMYATGGVHPVRRWRRNFALFLPQLATELVAGQLDLTGLSPNDLRLCWEYQLLCYWAEQQKIQREQAAQMIRAIVSEVLFDLTQTMEVTCEVRPEQSFSTQLFFIDIEKVIAEVQQLWQAWQGAKIADRSPNSAPIIRQPEQLQQQTSAQLYQTLSQLLDGNQTLRDLGVRLQRDVLTVTRSLLPYIQMGLVELVSIADLPPPLASPTSPPISPQPSAPGALIACVDDSPLMCQTMEKILTVANYQFLGINDPLRAIAILLARKPDLIFLDLVMPNANGYEICAQLRKLSFFRNTPIVILTGNDGIIDRVRAKMVGSTDFLSKPVTPEIVLGAIEKYLYQEAVES
jgi:chemotaxis family two-component system response regulator PixG